MEELVNNLKEIKKSYPFDGVNYTSGFRHGLETAIELINNYNKHNVKCCFGKEDLQFIYENVDTGFKTFEDWYTDYILPI